MTTTKTRDLAAIDADLERLAEAKTERQRKLDQARAHLDEINADIAAAGAKYSPADLGAARDAIDYAVAGIDALEPQVLALREERRRFLADELIVEAGKVKTRVETDIDNALVRLGAAAEEVLAAAEARATAVEALVRRAREVSPDDRIMPPAPGHPWLGIDNVRFTRRRVAEEAQKEIGGVLRALARIGS